MNILINGIGGRMGRELASLALSGYRGARLVSGVDPTAPTLSDVPVYKTLSDVPEGMELDCIIDFSNHAATPTLLEFAASRGIPTVVATTGHTDDEKEAIVRAAKDVPVFFSANMSLGVALLVELAKRAALAMPDAEIEIVECHHSRKLDAPSGTALTLFDSIREVRKDAEAKLGRCGREKREPSEIGIHAIRMGNVIGEHEVILATDSETLRLKHEAHTRALFAEGAIAAADFIRTREAGLYTMKSLIEGEKI